MHPVSNASATSIILDRRKFLASASAFIASGLLSPQALALAGPVTFAQGAFDVGLHFKLAARNFFRRLPAAGVGRAKAHAHRAHR